jgi:PhnB protein
MSLHPYLFFTNTTRQAMTRYHEIFGGDLDIMSAADLPEGEATPFETADDFVIHAALTFGDGSGVKGAAINVTIDDADDARRIFEALADGGSVDMALGETFWSPLFGSCTDRFGVAWMVNVAPGAES